MLGVFLWTKFNQKGTTMTRYYDDFEPPIEFAYGELNQIMREENYYVF